ncbi:hypothetical protein ACET3X_006142 [Alternaria dauci]|uniref:Uncharacterized protein n=1 Tax=Alternaria dauci TaxID=48095 RepID=A0ABR3UHG9_9PLEO
MTDIPLPPSPSGQTKKEKKAAAKLLRKGKNVPLPQSDDADLIVQHPEQDSAPLEMESTSIFVGGPGAETAQDADGDLMALGPKDTSDAAAGYVPKVDQPETEGSSDEPWPFIVHPFQQDSLILYERVAAFNHFERTVKTDRREWDEGPRAPCELCGRKHGPPCGTPGQLAALRSALLEGKQLRKEWSEQGAQPLGLPHEEMLEGEVHMLDSHRGLTSTTAKTAFCGICAKYHPGGRKGCTVPFCTKGCNRNHQPWVACGAAEQRFALVNKHRNGGKGRSEEPAPAPSTAKATRGLDTDKFGIFYDSIGDDPTVVRDAAGLFKGLSKKRAAEESAEQAGSNKKGKKKAGGEGSCQYPKPTPKGPDGPDDKGKGKAKPKRGGASRLNGSIFSHR